MSHRAPATPLLGGGMSKVGRVRQAIRDRIASDEWRAGDQIPTIRQLCESFGVSHITVITGTSVPGGAHYQRSVWAHDRVRALRAARRQLQPTAAALSQRRLSYASRVTRCSAGSGAENLAKLPE